MTCACLHTPRDRGLYIHIPFCRQKCNYCDFASFAGLENYQEAYLAALEKEAAQYAGLSFSTLYIGGGTPSLLSVAQLDFLCRSLEKYFGSISSFAESTVEANPESLSADKLHLLHERGIKRLSIGLQSFQDMILKNIGRVHTAAMFLRAYEQARRAGFENINVDLIAGLPGQTEKQFLQGLKKLISLQPQHISVYALQVEEGTPFYRQGVQTDEDLVRRQWEQAHFLLQEAGYNHYEISNFARPGYESRHNINYWRNGEYVGLGSAAASFVQGQRRQNEPSVLAYIDKIQQQKTPVVYRETLQGKASLGERIMLGLRMLDGVRLTAQEQKIFAAEIADLRRRGLVEQKADLLKLTFEGMFLANQAFMAFVGPFEEL